MTPIKITRQKVRRLFFRLFSICLGLVLCLVLLEFSLRIGGFFTVVKKQKSYILPPGKLIIFAGDSWTAGSDAEPGKAFFDLLKADVDFANFSLVNNGYGGNNCFQIVNSIINYNCLPDSAVLCMGVNDWHLIGLNEFIEEAKNYFSEKEIEQMRKELKFHSHWSWFTKLKIYKLYCYLMGARRTETDIDLKTLDRMLASDLFWQTDLNFLNQYTNYDQMYEALPKLIQEVKGSNLDQKFYFVARRLGMDTAKMEEVLRKANMFFPNKLSIVSYDVYRRLDLRTKRIRDLNELRRLSIKWSLKLLKEWSKKHGVVVFIQTYPDTKRNNLFEPVNKRLKLYAGINNFEIIDHNLNGVDWKKYRTGWHVNNGGHRLMKETIKVKLLTFLNHS